METELHRLRNGVMRLSLLPLLLLPLPPLPLLLLPPLLLPLPLPRRAGPRPRLRNGVSRLWLRPSDRAKSLSQSS